MRSGKIQKILDTVEKMTKPSPEVELLEDLLSKTDEAEVEAASMKIKLWSMMNSKRCSVL
jgi:hypothetical protein